MMRNAVLTLAMLLLAGTCCAQIVSPSNSSASPKAPPATKPANVQKGAKPEYLEYTLLLRRPRSLTAADVRQVAERVFDTKFGDDLDSPDTVVEGRPDSVLVRRAGTDLVLAASRMKYLMHSKNPENPLHPLLATCLEQHTAFLSIIVEKSDDPQRTAEHKILMGKLLAQLADANSLALVADGPTAGYALSEELLRIMARGEPMPHEKDILEYTKKYANGEAMLQTRRQAAIENAFESSGTFLSAFKKRQPDQAFFALICAPQGSEDRFLVWIRVDNVVDNTLIGTVCYHYSPRESSPAIGKVRETRLNALMDWAYTVDGVVRGDFVNRADLRYRLAEPR